jgi:SAM-dependent methyltransferase
MKEYPVDKYFRANRERWDEITPIHARSELYNLEAFKAGKITLNPTLEQLPEIGDVSNKSLLHLQCHFGMDTLGFARLGAKVTGVDFSPKAIDLANSLSRELNIPADFVLCNIYDLRENLNNRFDIVYTSSGILCWLPDLKKWAEIIAHFLKPGGFFYIWEFHPFSWVFDNSAQATNLTVTESYFHRSEPTRWEAEGDYADWNAKVEHPSYEWAHSLGDVINSLIAAGLRIDFLHEYPLSGFKCFPFAEKGEDGYWHVKGDKIPLVFSVKATKPTSE